jgi:hypothetical protein
MTVRSFWKEERMLFRNNKVIELVLLAALLIFISLSILLDMLLVNLLLVISPLLHLRHLSDSYEINERNIVIKRYIRTTKISLDSIEHIRRIYGFAEEDIEDRSATYLIADGKNYKVLNRFAKNKAGVSIIDVLIDDYQIPIKNEKAMFIIKTRIRH